MKKRRVFRRFPVASECVDIQFCFIGNPKQSGYRREWVVPDDDESLVYVWIRRIEALDPEGMRSHKATAQLQKTVANLPVVNIADNKFYWNGACAEFLEVNNIWNKIYKNDITQRNGIQGFYFDIKLRQVPFPHELGKHQNDTELPGHIRFISTTDVLQQLKAKIGLPAKSQQKSINNKRSNHL